jgi:hypothetical protein
VDIGGEGIDSTQRPSRPIGAVRLRDGSIVVANAGTQDLRWYDATGKHGRALGDRGLGSGHFASLDWVGFSPTGSVAAFDYGRLRIAFFSQEGEFQDAVSLVVSFQSEPGSVRGILSDGSYLLIRDARHWARSMSRAGSTPEGLVRGPASVSRYSPDGSFLANLGTFDGAERIFSKGRSRIVRIGARPFGRDAVFAVSPDRFYVGTQDSYEIAVYDTTGTMKAIVRVGRENLPVTTRLIDRYKRGRLANVHERERADKERELAQLPYPDSMPAYGPILVDAAGNLWVSNYRPFGEGEPVWTVFDAEHRMLGEVSMPEGFTALQIGSDYVLGTFTDEQGEAHIRAYGLEKPQPSE